MFGGAAEQRPLGGMHVGRMHCISVCECGCRFAPWLILFSPVPLSLSILLPVTPKKEQGSLFRLVLAKEDLETQVEEELGRVMVSRL